MPVRTPPAGLPGSGALPFPATTLFRPAGIQLGQRQIVRPQRPQSLVLPNREHAKQTYLVVIRIARHANMLQINAVSLSQRCAPFGQFGDPFPHLPRNHRQYVQIPSLPSKPVSLPRHDSSSSAVGNKNQGSPGRLSFVPAFFCANPGQHIPMPRQRTAIPTQPFTHRTGHGIPAKRVLPQ